MPRSEIYEIHDNGGTPFKVEVNSDKLVKIRAAKDVLIKEIQAERIFIGDSPINDTTLYSGGWGKEYYGNSILLKLQGLRYMFIGDCIYEFNAIDDIVEFTSPVGNNDVPYPYAYDGVGNCYLMIEHVSLKVPDRNHSEPYDYYYNNMMLFTVQNHGSKFRNITGFRIGDNKYNLSWHHEPHAFENLMECESGQMFIKFGNKEEVMDKERFDQLMKNFNDNVLRATPMNVDIIVKRFQYEVD